MKKLIVLFIFLGLAFAIGLFAHADPGYVLFYYRHWSLETTLWFFLLSFFIFILLLFWFFAFVRGVSKISSRLSAWRSTRRLNKAIYETNKGLFELVVGSWSSAEKRLLRYAEQDDSYLLNCFAAAFAAQQQGNFKSRDLYLRTAKQSSPENEKIILFATARLQMAEHQYSTAETTLLTIKDTYGYNAGLLELLVKLYRLTGNWFDLLQIMPLIKKHKVFTKKVYSDLEGELYFELLKNALQEKKLTEFFDVYRSIPKALSSDENIQIVYIKALIAHDDIEQAEKLLFKRLDQDWSAELINLYGQLDHVHLYKRMQKAEKWLKDRPNDPDLLFVLAKMCRSQQLWGKAQDYLSQIIAIDPKAAAYREMAEIMVSLGQHDEAIRYFRLAAL
ncbi:MAG: hypothetical protein JXR42_03720 [Gammaproteobacteria bacterium]|nr:hypothetical protein [Gammaproteobacteria bacterium]